MATIKKTTIKKAQYGVKTKAKPSSTDSAYVNKYKNLGLAMEGRTGPANKLDSALYDFGFRRGVNKEKEVPGEGTLQRFGRWEGQNAKKSAVPKKKNGGAMKAKSGTSMKKCKYGC